jgi:hemerythrin-like metal-binding protein
MPIPFFDPIMKKRQNYSKKRAPFTSKKGQKVSLSYPLYFVKYYRVFIIIFYRIRIFSIHLYFQFRKIRMIIWKKEFETGINEIDSSNRLLVYEINEFYHKLLSEKNKEKMLSAFDLIIKITGIKFKIEILFYTEQHYNEMEIIMHAKTHNHLIYILEKAGINYAKGNISSIKHVADFLNLWFMEHMMSSDKKITVPEKRNQLLGLSVLS